MNSFKSWLNWSLKDQSTTFLNEREIKFFINDEENSVKIDDLSPEMSLNQYLRKKIQLFGTKYMCLEGGCGACVVAVAFLDPITLKNVLHAVNSCLVPIYKCFGWKIYVIDQIGNSKTGYHPIQKALAQFNGTQCGYCTPGMIMNMYALYEGGSVSQEEVENSFSGNMCRCTGYRPILQAFRSLAADACKNSKPTNCDIEDVPICKSDSENCEVICGRSLMKQSFLFQNDESKWYKAFSVNEVLDIIRKAGDEEYMIVGGNTATGVYRRSKNIKVFIDVANVENLLNHSIKEDKLIIGANMTLTNTKKLFYQMAEQHQMFAYIKKLANHIELMANVPVRNMGTIAGNLMLKHNHPEFPSDIFLTFTTVGATVTLIGTDGRKVIITIEEFSTYDMKNKIILNITIPSYTQSYKYFSFRVAKRAQNAHSMVNCGFLLDLDSENVVQSARIVYGGINPYFIRATRTEQYLIRKQLFNNAVLQGVFQRLAKELNPDSDPIDASPKFRKDVAIALFYKFVLSIAPDGIASLKNRSGGYDLKRPLSTGSQSFGTNTSYYPVSQPVTKLEALAQCSGKAQFVMDIPDQPHQLFAAFVLAKAPAYTKITKTDASKALAQLGVVDYYDQTDIPGDNNFIPVGDGWYNFGVEEIFCTGTVKFYNQPIGIIIAKSQVLAEEAAELVEITYERGKEKPLITIREVLANNSTDRIKEEGTNKAIRRGNDVTKIINGTIDIYGQYHFHLENQCVVIIPVEDGLNIYPSSQCLNLAQCAAAKALKISVNKVNVEIRRVGGSFGGKMSRNSLLSTAAAIAAYKLQKPIKFTLPFTTNMNVIGNRFPFSSNYEVGVDGKGKIQYLEAKLYTDLGYNSVNDNSSVAIIPEITKSYNCDTWNFSVYNVFTDKCSSAVCRAPGSLEAIAFIEIIIEHIAFELNLDPNLVRLANLENSDPKTAQYFRNLIEWADVNERRKAIEDFNKKNRWTKKGLAVVPMNYVLNGAGSWHALVSIFEGDGSVAVTSSGIELGQGINTKVAQTCAYSLGIPLDQISIKPCSSLTAPNDQNVALSFTSEVICFAVLKACEILKKRMKPVRDQIPTATWAELVLKCFQENIDLSASYMCNRSMPELRSYQIYGSTCAEVEIDILTGRHIVSRVDILEDTGSSLSPLIDIGQVEGAFVMGLGYWTSEELIYDRDGQLLTNRTWTYKPPGAKDIPVDFRVKFPENNPNSLGVLNSKATGEPAICMAIAIPLAIRRAVASARIDANPSASSWYLFNGPSTVEATFLNSFNDYAQYTL